MDFLFLPISGLNYCFYFFNEIAYLISIMERLKKFSELTSLSCILMLQKLSRRPNQKERYCWLMKYNYLILC